MAVREMQVWDGRRPLRRRHVVERHVTTLATMGVTVATERLDKPTDWCFEQDHHTLVVHVEGVMKRMESVFSAGPSSGVLPRAGDVWIIPAGHRYAALAQGGMARFVEVAVPTSLVGHASLTPRIAHRDPFLQGAATRLADLAGAEDDLSCMLRHAIGEAMRLHLLDAYGPQRVGNRTGAATLSDVAKGSIVAGLRDRLDGTHSLAGLAASVGLPVRSFLPAFRAAFGTTPWQYVLGVRLAEGARRLRETGDPVTEIALGVGFSTPSHFTTLFRRRFGVSPTAYRRETSLRSAPPV